MIAARHQKLWQWFFRIYLSLSMRRHFQAVSYRDKVEDRGLPILVICNHFSWWDGFWVLQLNERFFKRRFHVMMLEEQLRKHPFLSRLGAFSIRKQDRAALRSLNYARNLLSDSSNMLLVFPQGEIQSIYNQQLCFQKGWYRILENISHPVQVLMVANLVDYHAFRKPSLNVYMQDFALGPETDYKDLVHAYSVFFHSSVKRQKEQV